MDNLNAILKSFSSLLQERFGNGIITTEDSIRYLFFHSVLQNGLVLPNQIVLEYPHTAIEKAEIDTYIDFGNNKIALFEFKYDREIPSGRNLPKTMKAGAIFNDIYRLAVFSEKEKEVSKYFIYVTDKNMHGYFTNPSNNLERVYNLPENCVFHLNADFMADKPETFNNQISGPLNCKIGKIFGDDNLEGNHLRVFKVF